MWLLAGAASAQTVAWTAPWEFWTDLRRVSVVPQDGRTLLRSSHCPSGCRKDRHSAGDERYLRRDGKEGVIFEEAGPGAITRIWMTTSAGTGVSAAIDPRIRLRIYFDGEATARIDLPLAELFSGNSAPFTAPLVGDRLSSSGGYFSYLPLVYQDGCRVTLEGADKTNLWFQFSFHRLRSDRVLATFAGDEDLSRLRQLMATPGADPWLSQSDYPAGTTTEAVVDLAPGELTPIFAAVGTGLLDAFKLDLPAEAWQQVKVILRFDGETTADLPVADFFALGSVQPGLASELPTRSLLLGLDAAGRLYSYWPMPFHSGATFWLLNQGDETVPVAYGVRRSALGPLPGSGRFAVTLKVAAPLTTSGDLPVLALEGAGKWVGLFAEMGSVDGVNSLYLEGDERIYLDGSAHPALYGTGVEDTFNGGFYFDQGPFGRALHGMEFKRRVAGPVANEERAAAYRWMLADAVSFAGGLRAGFERGPTGDSTLRARTVAFHYLAPPPALVAVDQLDLSDPASRAEHDFQSDPAARDYLLTGLFEGEPAVALSAAGLRRPAGSSSTFTFDSAGCGGGLLLRRRFDARHGGQAGEIWIDGQPVAALSYAAPNGDRRWREVDLHLPPRAAGPLAIEVRAAPAPAGERRRLFRRRATTDFTEFRYELWCRIDDRIFADGFESGGLAAWSPAERLPWPH